MRSLSFENNYPWIAGLIAGALWFHYELSFLDGNTNVILGASITMASIFTGFIATAKSLLLSISGSRVMCDLRQSGYIDTLIDYQLFAVNTSLATCIWSMAGFFIEPSMEVWFASGWAFLCVTMLSAFYRVTSVMAKVIKRSARE